MKDVFEIKFESKISVGAATPDIGKTITKVVTEAMPFVKRLAEAYTKEVEAELSNKKPEGDKNE